MNDDLATLPVVVVSAWTREAAQIADRAEAFLCKPITLETLLDTVDRYCQRAG
jgi:hypothetical protein